MDTTTFFDNFERLAEAPNGVGKLRELILQMAVQGRLVPQDPNDEPAAVLLGRIDAAKKALERGSRVTKDAVVPEIQASKLPCRVPPNWVWTRLRRVGIVSPRNEALDDTEASFVPMALISATYAEPIQMETRPWKEIRQGFTHFAEGDVVMAKITPCFQNGKSAVVRGLRNDIGAGTTELHVFRPVADTMCPEYVLLYLKSPRFLADGVGRMTGSAGQKRVPTEYFANNPFPLPPLAEQRRIVAKVDELMRLCDELEGRVERQREARERLSAAALDRLVTACEPNEFATSWQRICDHFDLLYDVPETLAQLRQAILQLAVRGKLVAQNTDDEPIKATIRTSRDSAGLPPTQYLTGQGESGHFPLPAGWCWVTLKDVADHRLGKMLDQDKNTGYFHPYLRNTNVQWFCFALGDIKEMRFEEEELDEYEVRSGDLLICEGGHGIGRTAVWECQLERVMFQKALHRVRPLACLNSYFLAFCVRAYDANGTLQRYYTGAGIPHFTGKSLAKVLFPLPPLAEQRRIVAKVNELMSLCDALGAKLRQSQADCNRLLEAAVHHLLKQRAVEAASCPA